MYTVGLYKDEPKFKTTAVFDKCEFTNNIEVTSGCAL